MIERYPSPFNFKMRSIYQPTPDSLRGSETEGVSMVDACLHLSTRGIESTAFLLSENESCSHIPYTMLRHSSDRENHLVVFQVAYLSNVYKGLMHR